MASDAGFKENAGQRPDIEWDIASMDTVLFNLLDRLQREKRLLTIREHRRFRADPRLHGTGSPKPA